MSKKSDDKARFWHFRRRTIVSIVLAIIAALFGLVTGGVAAAIAWFLFVGVFAVIYGLLANIIPKKYRREGPGSTRISVPPDL